MVTSLHANHAGANGNCAPRALVRTTPGAALAPPALTALGSHRIARIGMRLTSAAEGDRRQAAVIDLRTSSGQATPSSAQQLVAIHTSTAPHQAVAPSTSSLSERMLPVIHVATTVRGVVYNRAPLTPAHAGARTSATIGAPQCEWREIRLGRSESALAHIPCSSRSLLRIVASSRFARVRTALRGRPRAHAQHRRGHQVPRYVSGVEGRLEPHVRAFHSAHVLCAGHMTREVDSCARFRRRAGRRNGRARAGHVDAASRRGRDSACDAERGAREQHAAHVRSTGRHRRATGAVCAVRAVRANVAAVAAPPVIRSASTRRRRAAYAPRCGARSRELRSTLRPPSATGSRPHRAAP